MDDFELRMERAMLEGVVTKKPTLQPFILESVTKAARDLDETQKQIQDLIEQQRVHPSFNTNPSSAQPRQDAG
jgi:hypothetical protein